MCIYLQQKARLQAHIGVTVENASGGRYEEEGQFTASARAIIETLRENDDEHELADNFLFSCAVKTLFAVYFCRSRKKQLSDWLPRASQLLDAERFLVALG